MKYVEADQDASIYIPFKVDGDFVVPDEDSVAYQLYDNAGEPLGDATAVAPTSGATVAIITIDADNNSKGDLTTALRTIVVSFTYNSKPFKYRTSYTLIGFMNHGLSEEDVRASAGLDDGEFPDSDMDIVSAYLRLEQDLGADVLAEALSAGGTTSLAAREAIKYSTILDAIPALRRRVSSRRAADGSSQQKADVNFDKLVTEATAKVNQALDAISGATAAVPLLMVVGSRTDILTGS